MPRLKRRRRIDRKITSGRVKAVLRNKLPRGFVGELLQRVPKRRESDCCTKHGRDPIIVARAPTYSWNRYTIVATQTCGIDRVWIVIAERRGFFKMGRVVAAAITFGFCRRVARVSTYFRRAKGVRYYIIYGASDCCGKSGTFFYVV